MLDLLLEGNEVGKGFKCLTRMVGVLEQIYFMVQRKEEEKWEGRWRSRSRKRMEENPMTSAKTCWIWDLIFFFWLFSFYFITIILTLQFS